MTVCAAAFGLMNCTESQTEDTVRPRLFVSVPEEQDGRQVDVAADREDLVAGEGRECAVAGPVDDGVQRAEVVGLRPRGAAAVGEGGLEQLLPFAFEVARRRRLVTCRSAR